MTEDIINRLEELRQWQEKQQQNLFDQQNTQREKLGLEQQQIYELLGLNSLKKLSDTSPINNSTNGSRINKNHHCDNINQIEQNTVHEHDLKLSCQDLYAISEPLDDKKPKDTINTEHCLKDINNDNEIKLNFNEQNIKNEVKPFLKRGEGLKNRFKVDPNIFRLHNLPKYKFANAHKRTHYCVKNIATGKKTANKFYITNSTDKNTNLITQDAENKSSKIINNIKNKNDNSLLHEHNYGTNELKEQTSLSLANNKTTSPDKIKSKIKNFEEISWANVLETTNIQPTIIKQYRPGTSSPNQSNVLDDSDNLSIFELLEQKAQDDNFSLNASNIKKWIQEKADILTKQTAIAVANKAIIENLKKNRITPFPCDVTDEVIPDDLNISDYSTLSSNDNCESLEQKAHDDKHVRFAKEIKVNDYHSDIVTPTEIYDDNSSTNYISDVEHFKENLFATKNLGTRNSTVLEVHLDTSSKSINTKDTLLHNITEKTDLLKKRLFELEAEILLFKENNLELKRLKQQHDLDVVQLHQERLEILDKLEEDKIKQEIYLHDERMKIENERKKFEKIKKDQRNPNKKDREEILKLKDQVECLQKEAKLKEGNHVAAKARLRAQMRNMEKELKDLYTEIEHLKKEKRQLQTENAKLTRNSNNTILTEINKTISKLAPNHFEPPIPIEVRNRNTKPVVAKIISHKKQPVSDNVTRNKNLVRVKSNEQVSIDEKDPKSNYYNKCLHNSMSSEEFSSNHSEKSSKKHSPKSDKIKKSLDEQTSDSTKSISNKSFKREINNTDGSKDIWYPNGNIKKISSDGLCIRMLYFNKDIKETNILEGTVKYYYDETNTWHTTYLDGLEILEFPNGQTEHRYKNGTVEVHFPNGSIRLTNPIDQNKAEEWRYSDGTVVTHMKNGDKILSLPNGQIEIHSKHNKRREYPDGTVKILYPDCSQETRYSNGRVRLKDKDGNLVMDSENIKY